VENKRIKILVIDDEKDLLENIETILSEEGYEVVTAFDGLDGIKKFIREKPDLIICDVLMPNMDGYEVLDKISNISLKPIPFIYLTAKIESADLRKGMNKGADDYIFKPFETDDLLKTINVRLEKFGINPSEKRVVKSKEDKNFTEDKIFVNFNNIIQPVAIKDIKIIEAQNQYTKLFINNGNSVVLKKSLTQWEASLPEKTFIRVHRSFLVNISYIKKIEKGEKNQYQVFLHGLENPVEVSRRYSSKVLLLIKNKG
jgi:DNA-binding LytR/AlgR family response regulator